MADQRDYFLVAYQDGNKIFEIELTEEEYLIGRVQHPGGIQLAHDAVSSRHAMIYRDSGVYFIEDLGSTNGTTVNGHRLKKNIPQPLNEEDEINIPSMPTVFILRVNFGKEAPPPAPEPAKAKPKAKPKETADEGTKTTAAKPEKAPAKKPATKKKSSKSKQPTYKTRVISGQDPSLFQIGGDAGGGSRFTPPPTLERTSKMSRYMTYLPGIYHTDFMRRFILMFESIYAPIEWTVDHFDLFLDPYSAPNDFLGWFATWYEFTFDDSWSEGQRRIFFQRAHLLYRRKGTKWALEEMLKIYLGDRLEVDDTSKKLDPFSFQIKIKAKQAEVNEPSIRRIIELNKPAHTTYEILYLNK